MTMTTISTTMMNDRADHDPVLIQVKNYNDSYDDYGNNIKTLTNDRADDDLVLISVEGYDDGYYDDDNDINDDDERQR